MNEPKRIIDLFERRGAIIEGHFVLAGGKHSDTYIDKDALLVSPKETFLISRHMATKLSNSNLDIDVVAGPQMGGALLASWVAFHLSTNRHRVLSIYLEKKDGRITIRPGHIKLMRNKRIAVVDDIITTGESISKAVQAIYEAGEIVTALGALWNRGNVTLRDIYNSWGMKLFSLVNQTLNTWSEDQCPLCQAGKPINTDMGHGQEFLEKNKDRILVCPACGGLADWIDKLKGICRCRQCGLVPSGYEVE